MTKVAIFTGPVAAGKTTALRVADDLGYETVSMGDVAREIHSEADTDLSVSEWADKRRKVDGPTFLIEEVVNHLHHLNEVDNVAIDGIRDPTEIEYLEAEFNEVVTYLLWASQLERYFRTQDREGRSQFDSFGKFLERDTREMQWGLPEILDGNYIDRPIDTEELDECDFETLMRSQLSDAPVKTKVNIPSLFNVV